MIDTHYHNNLNDILDESADYWHPWVRKTTKGDTKR